MRTWILSLLLLPACTTPVAPPIARIPVPADAQSAVVVRPVDGDTVVLRGRGSGPLPARPTRVRLLLVDTPEVGTGPECFGPEAANRAEQLLPDGSEVRVQADRDPKDRFGRPLLHVWNDAGVEVGQALLSEGFATVLVVRPNTAYLRAYRDAERQAEQAGRGLWSACS